MTGTKPKTATNPGLVLIAAAAESAGFTEYLFEYRFAVRRKFRFDLAFPRFKVAFEREGSTWKGGRHTSGTGYRNDVRKYNLAASLGWSVVRGTVDMMQDGTALTDLLAVLELKRAEGLPRR